MLTHWGATARTSNSALTALELFRQWTPDILLSNIAMPGKDGNWLLENVRKFEETHGGHVPAIAQTAYAGIDERAAILAGGYDEILSKPIEPFKLLENLSKFAKVIV